MRGKPAIIEEIVLQAYEDYFVRDVSWRALEAKYGILHGSFYGAFKRRGLRLRTKSQHAPQQKEGEG